MATWFRRLRSWARRPDLERELDDELAFYLDRRLQAHLAAGLNADDAYRAARRDLGSVAYLKEQVRDVRRLGFLADVAQDVWYAWRAFKRTPGFTAIIVLSLALGLGATTAVFSIANFLVFRPLPVTDPSRLVVPYVQQRGEAVGQGFSVPDYRDIARDTAATFEGVIASRELIDGMSVNGRAERVIDLYVTSNFFSVLGVQPTRGRFFAPPEGDRVLADPVLVLSDAYWKRRFGADPAIVGKVVSVDGHSVEVVGIAPPGFYGVTPFNHVDAYLPLGMAPISGADPNEFLNDRRYRAIELICRLRPGVSRQQAEAAVDVEAQRLSRDHPAEDRNLRLPLFPEWQTRVGDPRTNRLGFLSSLFIGLTAIVLLLSCTTVANLLIVRATARYRELGVRAALGAGTGRLARQLLTEGALLALTGGVVGLLFSVLATAVVARTNLHTDIPIRLDFGLDWRVILYAVTAMFVASLIVGTAPAVHIARRNLSTILHANDRNTTGRDHHVRGALVVAQVAGSMALLVVAGLFTRSLNRAQQTDLGIDPNGVLNFTMDPLLTGTHRSQGTAFFKTLQDRVRTLPGVLHVSTASSTPMSYLITADAMTVSGYVPPIGQPRPFVFYNPVSSEFFDTLRIAITRGRSFTDADDREQATPVAIVSEAFVARYWPTLDPMGRTLTLLTAPQHPFRVVGVAADVRYRGLTGPTRPYVYIPFSQRPGDDSWATVQIRTTSSPESLKPELEHLLASVAPDLAVWDVQTMRESLYTLWGLLTFRLGAVFAACFGAIALILTIIGVYGVVSYDTSRKTREIGIRVAFGAEPVALLRMILRHGLVLVVGGLIAGSAAALVASKAVGTFLIVSPSDFRVYLIVGALLVVVATLACLVPAWKAVRTDPIVALRSE